MASGFRMYPSQAPPQESRFRPQPPPSSGSRFFPSGTFKRAGGGGGTYRSSTLLHKGFYDLLSVLKPEPALDPLVSASPLAGPRYEDHPRPGSGPRSPTLPTPRGGVNTMPGSMPRGAVLAGGGGEGAVGGGERGTGGRGPNAAMLDYPLPPGFGGERIEFSSTASRSSPAAVKGEKKVISKDMIGRPTQFVHVLHASDADQAQEMLMRFAAEGVGKMPDENWAKTIKGIITARAKQRQALAIAEVQDAIHRESYNAYNGPLHVTNGLPSSAGYPSTIRSPLSTPTNEKTLSIMTQATIGHPSTVKQSSPLRGPNSPASSPLSSGAPPFPATALQRKPSPPELLRADTAQTVVVRPLPEVPTTPTPTPASIPGMPGTSTAPSTPISKTNGEAPPAFPPRPIVPTMETLERAASAAIFFETLYHGLLKSAVSHQNPHQTRERRRRALERDLERRPDLTEAERREARERLRFEETAWLREKRKKVGVKEFSKVKVIGHGAFGVVSLVRERETNALYAMKQLRKGDMLRKGQEGHVRSERDLLAAAASEGTSDASWIVKLHYSFQDADHLYLVLDYMGGGDLLNLLVEKDIFPEDFTRFYIAEMVLSLEACHKLGYIHRDIKPDNFLIGPDGHLCVSDFGLATDLHWAHDTTYYEQQRRDLLKRHGIDLEEPSSVGGRAAKKLDRKTAEQIMGGEEGLLTWRDKNRKKLAYSVAGTNSYMAPEVIRGLGYGFSCDWWSLGVIMYECLYGYPPFVSQSRQATRQKILNWQSSLRFPPRPRVSREAIDLMTALLCEPSDRIGSNFEPQRPNSHIIQERRSGFLSPPAGALSGDGADQIKAHPWFKGIDFSTIHLERAPYQPEMRDPADTRHFDEDIPDEPLAPAGGGAPDATKDPVLKHRVHGAHVLDIRKQKAFAGFTYKAPRPISRGAIPTGLGGPSSSDELTEPSMLASSTTQQQAFPAILFRPDVAPAATAAVGAAAFSGTVRGRALSL